MRTGRLGLAGVTVTAGTALGVLLSGCTGPAGANVQPSTPGSAQVEPRGQLAARVAIAKDRRYVVSYTLVTPGRPMRSIIVSVAQDRTWRVDVQGGALGGQADVAIAGRPEGQYQCPLGATPSCVRVAAADKKIPAAVDPRVQYLFTSWLDLLSDRQLPMSVAVVTVAGLSGTCFSVEPAVTGVLPPLDPGTFCYSDDGMLTGAKLPLGTLTLTGEPTSAPPTITLPGPVVSAPPLGTAAPPPPPSASVGPSTRPSSKPSTKPASKPSTKPAPKSSH